MAHSIRKQLILLLSVLFIPPVLIAQNSPGSYEISASPDLWYNRVDGLRVGARIEGRAAGTHEEGPHRVDLGIWIGTFLPVHPLSYQLSWTEPIPSWSEYGSEAAFKLQSLMREGVQSHGLRFDKRWQRGDEPANFTSISFGYNYLKRYDSNYTLYPTLWSMKQSHLLLSEWRWQQVDRLGRTRLTIHQMLQPNAPEIRTASFTILRSIAMRWGFGIRARAFGGVASDDTLPEFLWMYSVGPAVEHIHRPFLRSRGTIPESWMRSGIINTSGGAGLRGYTKTDIVSLEADSPKLHRTILSFSVELDLPNPFSSTNPSMESVSNLFSFRSYLFTDQGYLPQESLRRRVTNAGAGAALTLNIPDYLDRPRGFVIRYEVPFWLSDPAGTPAWSWRHLIGIGATITF